MRVNKVVELRSELGTGLDRCMKNRHSRKVEGHTTSSGAAPISYSGVDITSEDSVTSIFALRATEHSRQRKGVLAAMSIKTQLKKRQPSLANPDDKAFSRATNLKVSE